MYSRLEISSISTIIERRSSRSCPLVHSRSMIRWTRRRLSLRRRNLRPGQRQRKSNSKPCVSISEERVFPLEKRSYLGTWILNTTFMDLSTAPVRVSALSKYNWKRNFRRRSSLGCYRTGLTRKMEMKSASTRLSRSIIVRHSAMFRIVSNAFSLIVAAQPTLWAIPFKIMIKISLWKLQRQKNHTSRKAMRNQVKISKREWTKLRSCRLLEDFWSSTRTSQRESSNWWLIMSFRSRSTNKESGIMTSSTSYILKRINTSVLTTLPRKFSWRRGLGKATLKISLTAFGR